MLSRLIHHEWKETWRIPVISFIVILFLTLVCFICFRQMEPPADENSINAGAFVIMMLYCLIISCISMVVTIYIAIRFYRNLYTDEGYLMHTLPVSASAHIWSKLIVCFIWEFIDITLVILSVFALFVNMDILRALPQGLSELFSSFPDAFGVPAGVGIPLYLLLFLLDSISSILCIYMCIAVGHSFNNHKILASVGIYVGVSMLQSFISMIFTGITGMVSYGTSSALIGVSNTMSAATNFWLSWIVSMIICIVTGTASYLLANYFMTKKLNLE